MNFRGRCWTSYPLIAHVDYVKPVTSPAAWLLHSRAHARIVTETTKNQNDRY